MLRRALARTADLEPDLDSDRETARSRPEMIRRLILGFAILAAFFFLATIAFYPWIAVGVLFLSHLLLLYPTLVANCQWWGRVVTRFETPRPEVWLTIDD